MRSLDMRYHVCDNVRLRKTIYTTVGRLFSGEHLRHSASLFTCRATGNPKIFFTARELMNVTKPQYSAYRTCALLWADHHTSRLKSANKTECKQNRVQTAAWRCCLCVALSLGQHRVCGEYGVPFWRDKNRVLCRCGSGKRFGSSSRILTF